MASVYYTKDPEGERHREQVYHHLNAAKKHSADASFKFSDGFLKIFWEDDLSGGIDTYIQGLKKKNIPESTIKGTYDWLCKRDHEDSNLIETLKGLILYYRLDPEKGKEKLISIKSTLRVTKQHPVLLNKLEKIVPE